MTRCFAMCITSLASFVFSLSSLTTATCCRIERMNKYTCPVCACEREQWRPVDQKTAFEIPHTSGSHIWSVCYVNLVIHNNNTYIYIHTRDQQELLFRCAALHVSLYSCLHIKLQPPTCFRPYLVSERPLASQLLSNWNQNHYYMCHTNTRESVCTFMCVSAYLIAFIAHNCSIIGCSEDVLT